MLSAILFLIISTDPVPTPTCLDNRFELSLIAREPNIMTPTGVAIDKKGRVFVVECHTHFRPKDYPGPKSDRILLFKDFAGDGSAIPKVFFEGTQATMNIGISPAGDLFIATRKEILCIRHVDQLDQATSPENIAHLETKGDYPHNGLSGFAFDNQGHLWVGLGENLGADYTFIAADGSFAKGGGEGGSVYRLNTAGSQLQRIATGFWNPFHLYRNPQGSLFAIDNDPDSRPPCRLLHIVGGGDYGFKFRYGRNGLHPFHAWNGELPGTLPMMAGTGEAPSGMVGIEAAHWPADTLGQLLITSWGDHRIERFQPKRWESSFKATLDPLVVGNESFRPVGIAIGPSTDIFFSDWVDKSYELHQKGRLWRLRLKPSNLSPSAASQSTILDESPEPKTTPAAISDLTLADPFARTRARNHLIHHLPLADLVNHFRSATGPAKVEWLLTVRDSDPSDRSQVIESALADADPLVRLVAVQWVGDKQLTQYSGAIEQMLNRPYAWTRPLFESTLATIELLNKKWASADAGSQFIVRLLERPDLEPSLYRFGLRSLPANHPWLTPERLSTLAKSPDQELAIEAVRTWRESSLPSRSENLMNLAGDTDLSPMVRAEAILGLQTIPSDNTLGVLLVDLSQENDPLIQATALRVIERAAQAQQPPAVVPRSVESLEHLLTSPGNVAAGERLFFDPAGPGCFRCHQVSGRGGSAGPELTTYARGSNRQRLLASLIDPSREIAPMYVPWIVVTTAGTTSLGLLVREGLEGEQFYIGSDSKEFMLKPDQIDERRESKESIMPRGLLDRATDTELRDLITYLESLK
jgi:putative membrane-bound dehydrogenase-like protein